jgi:Ca-activated chloride channel family protein
MKWNLVLATATVLGSAAGLMYLPAAANAQAPTRIARGPMRYTRVAAATPAITEGTLVRINPKDPDAIEPCPLKHTDVKAEITGYIARVYVTQEFTNPTKEKIEAVYKFPLPPGSAVDAMTMLVGDRKIFGKIKQREEAKKIYEEARNAGRLASLLDQERPNIFTQSVANIGPGQSVKIEIAYVEPLKYEDAAYEFSFPMVVGPRYTPRSMNDPGAVVPKRTPEGVRAGHDLSIQVALDAGMPLAKLDSPTHVVDISRPNAVKATVKLKDLATIPNKDFILRYAVNAPKIEDTVLANTGVKGGYFMLVLQPPERVAKSEVAPKEIVFVLDTSGSMMGFPIEKAKEAMQMAIDGLNPRDTFNLITFSGDTAILFPQPVPATPENVRKAQEFLSTRRGSGGTEMMKAIRAALDPSDQQDHVRIACFMTDGEVGNDFEIIGEVKRYPNARVFSFGIGSSTNHFLLDNMARFGRGEVEYVGLSDDGSAAARRFHERVQNPVLTDIALDFGGLPVTEVYPKRIPDLFSAKPVIVFGRYTGAANGTIKLKGRLGGRAFERAIAVKLPPVESGHDVIPTMWARAKVDDLMGQDLVGAQSGQVRGDLKDAITKLGLDYAIMTQFTSFVAVEESTVTEPGKPPRRIEVPVEMPEGVSYEGVYGDSRMAKMTAMPMQARMYRAGAGVVGGVPGGVVGGIIDSQAEAAPPPPAPARSDRAVNDASGVAWKISPALQNAAPGGKLTVQVYVSAVNDGVLKKLKDAGLEILPQQHSGQIVVGRIDSAKLQALAKLTEVRFIAPQN